MANFNALNHMNIARIRKSHTRYINHMNIARIFESRIQAIIAIVVNILNLKPGKY